MNRKPKDSPFEAWLATLAMSDDRVNESIAWLRTFFEEEGPVDRDTVMLAYELAQLTLTDEALRIVLDDIHRTTSLRPACKIDSFWGGVSIVIDDGYQQSSLTAVPEPQLILQEVADYMQEFVMGDKTVWPTCSKHRTGLHPDLIDSTAVWRCRYGDHTVAAIGTLPTAEA